MVVDGPHFTEHLARTQLREDHFASFLVTHLDLQRTGEHHENGVGGIPGLDHLGATADMLETGILGDFLEALVAECFEYGQGAQGHQGYG